MVRNTHVGEQAPLHATSKPGLVEHQNWCFQLQMQHVYSFSVLHLQWRGVSCYVDRRSVPSGSAADASLVVSEEQLDAIASRSCACAGIAYNICHAAVLVCLTQAMQGCVGTPMRAGVL